MNQSLCLSSQPIIPQYLIASESSDYICSELTSANTTAHFAYCCPGQSTNPPTFTSSAATLDLQNCTYTYCDHFTSGDDVLSFENCVNEFRIGNQSSNGTMATDTDSGVFCISHFKNKNDGQRLNGTIRWMGSLMIILGVLGQL